jgi:hypothetical protein
VQYDAESKTATQTSYRENLQPGMTEQNRPAEQLQPAELEQQTTSWTWDAARQKYWRYKLVNNKWELEWSE